MIRIEISSLAQICDSYSTAIQSKFFRFSNAFVKLIDLVTANRPCGLKDLKGSKHITMYASLKILCPDTPKIKNITEEQLRDVINSMQTITDKQSESRKNLSLNELKLSLISLQTFVTKENLFGAEICNLKKIDDDFKKQFADHISEEIIAFLFNYERYRSEIDNYSAKMLNIKVCPYCNRNYITYLPKNNNASSKKKDIGATYDHFFKKEIYKSITISFFNLIPSCYVCNSNLKLNKDFDHLKNLNPFVDGFGEDAAFDFDLDPDPLTGEINFRPKLVEKKGIEKNRKIQIFGNDTNDDSGNIRVFKLQEIYKSHNDTVEDIHSNFDKHNRFYADSLIEELKGIGASEAEFYRYHFKNYYDEVDFNKRPLSKLTKDIYLKMKKMI